MTQPSSHSAPDIDRIAIVLSALCIVHCLALPLMLLAMPVMAQFADSHWHTPMLVLAIPVSTLAIVMGYLRHGNLRLVAGVALGLFLLVSGATIGHAYFGPAADRGLTIAGSLILAWMHWQNSRLIRRCVLRGDTVLAET